MSRDLRLGTTQQLLWDLITAPEGAAAGAETLHREGAVPDPELAFLVRPHGEMSAVERVDVYANMYFYRLHDCLAEDFPALAGHLGAAGFNNLVTDYLLAHPSIHYSLRELGRMLPAFVATHALAESRPLAAGLAELEWARVDVFDEADATPITRETILERGMADPESFRLKSVPGLRVVLAKPGVLSLWRQATSDDGESAAQPVDAGSELVPARVWRKGFAVWHRSIEADEAACLSRLAGKGATLGDLGETLLEFVADGQDEAVAMQRLAGLLEGWAADEIVTGS